MSDGPTIDLKKIDFPSDGLTIKAIRQRWPESVDTGESVDLFSRPAGGRAGEVLMAMLTMERDLAKATFDLKFGKETNILYADDNVNYVAHDLIKSYISVGIADGPTTAKELIRGIKSQAAEQAQQHLPPRP